MTRNVAWVAAVFAFGYATAPAAAMSGYLWKYRPVVVFAATDADVGLAEQRRIVAANRKGFSERHVAVVWVAGNSVSAELGPGPGMTAAQLRARFGVAAGSFRAVLVGKDGGTKLSQSTPLSAATLFGAIDAMPMRRDEMRRPR